MFAIKTPRTFDWDPDRNPTARWENQVIFARITQEVWGVYRPYEWTLFRDDEWDLVVANDPVGLRPGTWKMRPWHFPIDHRGQRHTETYTYTAQDIGVMCESVHVAWRAAFKAGLITLRSQSPRENQRGREDEAPLKTRPSDMSPEEFQREVRRCHVNLSEAAAAVQQAASRVRVHIRRPHMLTTSQTVNEILERGNS